LRETPAANKKAAHQVAATVGASKESKCQARGKAVARRCAFGERFVVVFSNCAGTRARTAGILVDTARLSRNGEKRRRPRGIEPFVHNLAASYYVGLLAVGLRSAQIEL
jgi:hypothetical protein